MEHADIYLFQPEDFLIVLSNRADLERLLRQPYLEEAPFRLVFKRWRRELSASAGPLQFQVLVELHNIPAHAWNLSTVASLLGSSVSNIRPTSDTIARTDLRSYRVIDWTIDPDIIPIGRILVVPEPKAPFQGGPPLFLKPEECIESSEPALHHSVEINLLQIQDWRLPSDYSSGDDMRHDHWWTESDDDDEWPGSQGHNFLSSWPKILCLSDSTADAGSSRVAGGHSGSGAQGGANDDTRPRRCANGYLGSLMTTTSGILAHPTNQRSTTATQQARPNSLQRLWSRLSRIRGACRGVRTL